ncbi:MAG TPA: hypothetical protein ENJ49_00600 [Candidatus Moranbacteria bacterium]|nr:hypothetical protein [Candidatus Moranbacteria bacterium]
MKIIFISNLFLLFLILSCVSDAPHDNPLDAAHGNKGVRVSGKVLTFYPPFHPVSGAQILLFPDNRIEFSDLQGNFSFGNVQPGVVEIITSAPTYASDTLFVNLKTTDKDLLIHLDALPIFEQVKIRSHHLKQWFPVEDTYYLELRVQVGDPDGKGDVSRVFFSVPDLAYKDTLNATAQPGHFEKYLSQEQLPIPNLAQIIGKKFDFQAVDQPGNSAYSHDHFLPRIIEATPQLISPVGLQTVNGDSVVFTWQKIHLNYFFTFKIELFQINLGVFTRVATIDGIPDTEDRFAYSTGNLLSGQYFWRVYIVDEFGDTSGSKEAAFQIP